MEFGCSHNSCVLSSLRGLSRGITYGAKVRFTHSIVMALLFGRGSWSNRLRMILKNTYDHGKMLGSYVFLYKSIQCLITRLLQKKQPLNSLFAGGIAGYVIFSKETPITSQITLYLFSRVTTALVAHLYRKQVIPQVGSKYTFTILTTVCWALVMYLFEKNRSVLQNSLTKSMTYLYDESDQWQDFFDFVPYGDTFKAMLKF